MFAAAIARRAPMVPLVMVIAAAWLFTAASPMEHSSPSFWLGWTVMAVAMMLPTVIGVAAYAADRSALRAALFSLGYVAVWASVAPLAYVAMNAVAWNSMSVALLWIAVGVYQLSPVVRRAVQHCHERKRCARPMTFGMKQGVACVVSCFPLMLAAMLTLMVWQPGAVIAAAVLVALTVFMAVEKRPRMLRLLPASGAVCIALAAVTLVLAPVGNVHVHAAGQVAHFNQQ